MTPEETYDNPHGFLWEMFHSVSGWITIALMLHAVAAQMLGPIEWTFVAWVLFAVWVFALGGTCVMINIMMGGVSSPKKESHA